MVGLISVFVLFWLAIFWDVRRIQKSQNEEDLAAWDKPYYVEENLFEHNGRTWERLYNHPSGRPLRVFTEDMLDYDYKETLD